MKSERIVQFDVVKGIGILLVILGHCCTPPSYTLTWIYGFHMPLFFIVSGCFFKPDTFKNIIRKDIKRIIYPWIYFSLLLFIWDLTYWTYKESSILAALNVIWNDFNPLNDNCRVLYHTIWFLPCLFEVHILYSLISKLSLGIRSVICLLLYAIGYVIVDLPFFIDTAFSVLIYYHIGYVLKQNNLWRNTNMKAGVITLMLYSVFIYLFMPRVEYFMNKFPYYILTISIPMFYVCMSFSNMCVNSNISLNRQIERFLVYCGKHSLIILGIQSIIIEILCMITFKLNIQSTAILFICTVPLSLIFVNMTKNRFPFA